MFHHAERDDYIASKYWHTPVAVVARLLEIAVCVLARRTNPEVLLQIETHAAQTKPAWKYSLVRLGSVEFHVSLDGREVWTEPRTPGVVGQPTDPYWLFFLRPGSPAAGKTPN